MAYLDTIKAIQEKAQGHGQDFSQNQVRALFTAFAEVLEEGRTSDEFSAAIPGIGTFTKVYKPATTARNPKTGETIDVAEKHAIAMKLTARLRKGR